MEESGSTRKTLSLYNEGEVYVNSIRPQRPHFCEV